MENNGCAAREEKGPGTARARAPPETPKMSNAGSAEGWAASLLVCGSVRSHRSSAPSPVLSTVAPFRRALPVEPARARIGGRHHRCPALRGVAVARADGVRPSGLVQLGPPRPLRQGQRSPASSEWQSLSVGQRLLATPDGRHWFEVAALEAERFLALRGNQGTSGTSAGQTTEWFRTRFGTRGTRVRTNHKPPKGNQRPANHRNERHAGEPGNQRRTNHRMVSGWFRARRRSSGRTWEPVPGQTTEWFRMVSSTSPGRSGRTRRRSRLPLECFGRCELPAEVAPARLSRHSSCSRASRGGNEHGARSASLRARPKQTRRVSTV